MKKLIATLWVGMLFATSIFAQQAALQVIHNSPDVGADSVDVYVNGNLLLDDFAFRTATPFDSVPAGVNLIVGIAPKTSNRSGGNGYTDTLTTFGPYNLAVATNYILIAQGVIDPSQYDPNNTNMSIGFELAVVANARSSFPSMDSIGVLVSHGSVDAPAVDIFANGGDVALLNDVPYSANTGGYLTVPAAEYVFDVAASADSANPVASFYLDASGLGGGAAVIFASGFLSPADEPMGAQGFGLFAALPNGDVAALTPIGTSKIQVIHNAADPAAEVVDIYVDLISDTVLLDDVAFRKATGFLEVPSGYPLKVAVAAGNSSSIADAITTISTPELADGENYHVVANGVLDPTSMDWTANPDMEDIGFQLFYQAGAREAAANNMEVDLSVFHGSTDAPTVDVLVNAGTPPFVDGATYGDFAPYQAVAPGDYDLNLTPDMDNSNLLYTFGGDVSSLAGRAGLILASGFLTNVTDATANRGGEAFGLLLILDNGDDVLLPLRNNTNIDDNFAQNGGLTQVVPNPVQNIAKLSFSLLRQEELNVKVYDAIGRMALSRQLGRFGVGSHETELNLSELTPGIYHLELNSQNIRSVRKIVISR
jgi:hypothetical protein